MSKQCVLLAALAAALTSTAAAQPVAVAIDATSAGQPISKLILGGYFEPATTGVWAEMLYDRKFLRDIDSQPPPSPAFPGARRNPWRPVGGDDVVKMDTGRPWVGEHSPVVTLAGTAPRGIRQSGLVLRAGTRYTGRVVLSGDPAAKVEVSVAWGPNPADRQTIPIRSLTGAYAKLPLQFIARGDTQDGSLEITGTGAGAFHIGAVSLMPADSLQGFRPGMMKYLKELGISIYRWPGGNFVSGYDWRDGVGDADQRPPRFFDPQRPGIESNDVGIDDFLFMCRLLGAEPYIAVNAGFGGAREAAEEVEYVNGSIDTRMGKLRAANGHPQPYNVKIWGVGNEMYGPWQLGHMSPNQYWIKHISFVKAMKKVDPSIKLIASSATIEEMSWGNIEEEQFPLDEWNWRLTGKVPFAYGSHEDWAGGMLANCADYIDYLGEHFYAHPTLTVDAATQRFVKSGDPLELIVRRLPNRLAYKFEAWQEYLRRMPSLKSRDIRFALDEFGTRTPGKMGPPPGPMVSALSNALTYHEMFRHSDMVAMAAYTWAVSRGVLTGSTGDGVGFLPDGLVIKLFRDHLSERLPVTVSGHSPQRPFPGVVGIDTAQTPSGSPTYPLDVFAAIHPDRKTLTVSVVNPTASAQEFDLSVSGVELRGAGKLWRLAAPGVDATNVAGRKPVVEIVESAIGQAPARVSVPAVSISVYELELR